MFRLIFCICAVTVAIATAVSAAEAPDTMWTRIYGDENHNQCNWAEITHDSGYVLVGYTVFQSSRAHDLYIVRTDKNGNQLWDQTFDIDEEQYGNCIRQTSDHGFITASYARLTDTTGYNIYVVKLDAGGAVQWTQEYDFEDKANYPYGMCLAPDGDIVISASACCYDGPARFQLTRINSDSTTEWNHTYEIGCTGSKVINTSDGGFAVVGDTAGVLQVLKLSSSGVLEYKKKYGYHGNGAGLVELNDGYMAFGTTDYAGLYDQDCWLLRLADNLDTVWTWHSMVLDNDYCWAGERTFDGGYIMVADWFPPGEDADILVIRTDSLGNILWSKTVGGVEGEYPTCVHQTADSGYVVAGRSRSYGNLSYYMYLVKLAKDPVYLTDVDDVEDELLPGFKLDQNYPNPFNPVTVISYSLAKKGRVKIDIYDILGRHIRTLVDEVQSAGAYTTTWDGTESSGKSAATGIYLYRLKVDGSVQAKKMLLLK